MNEREDLNLAVMKIPDFGICFRSHEDRELTASAKQAVRNQTSCQEYRCDIGTIFSAGNTVTTTSYLDVYFRTRLFFYRTRQHVSTARSHLQAILVIKYKRQYSVNN
jgi:hypothetical protein